MQIMPRIAITEELFLPEGYHLFADLRYRCRPHKIPSADFNPAADRL